MIVVFVIGGKYITVGCDPSHLFVSLMETTHSKNMATRDSTYLDKMILYITKSMCT